jgi:hypothetical protein
MIRMVATHEGINFSLGPKGGGHQLAALTNRQIVGAKSGCSGASQVPEEVPHCETVTFRGIDHTRQAAQKLDSELSLAENADRDLQTNLRGTK